MGVGMSFCKACISKTIWATGTTDSAIDGEFCLLSGKKYVIILKSHFGLEPTSKTINSHTKHLENYLKFVKHVSRELLGLWGQPTAQSMGNFVYYQEKICHGSEITFWSRTNKSKLPSIPEMIWNFESMFLPN